MPDAPLVSVFTPAYNSVEYIEEALRSAIEQDYSNVQVVAVDDGSTDGTAEVIAEFGRRHAQRVTALVGLPHVGLTANCNRTLKACRGKYIAFHAGDDVLLPGKIARQVAWLEQGEDRVLCGHDVEVFDSQTGRRLSVRRPSIRGGRGPGAFVRHGAFMYGQSIMVRASAVPPAGYDERLPVASDVKLWIDVLARTDGEFGCIDGIYARYRRHASNVTDVGLLHVSDHLRALDIIDREYPRLARDSEFRRAVLEAAVGEWHLSQLQLSEARRYLRRSLARRPLASWRTPLLLGLGCTPVPVLVAIRNAKRRLLGRAR